jgi:DNA-binding beta-propeller fold protein YncE
MPLPPLHVVLLLTLAAPADPIDAPARTIPALHGPEGLAWIDDDRLLVAEYDSGTLRIITADDTSRLEHVVQGPAGLDACADGTAYVAESRAHRILRIPGDGTAPIAIGSHGDGPGRFRTPLDVDVHADRMVVADTGNDRIQVLDQSGAHLLTIGARGTAPGQFRRPSAVAQCADGRIVVADTGNHRIQVFAADGTLLEHWGGRGSHPGLFAEPSGVDVVGGVIRVTDRLNHRVQAFTPDGEFIHAWGMHALKPREGDGRIHYPTALAVSPDGTRMAIAEPFEERVQVFGPHDATRVDDRPTTPARQGVQSHFGPVVSLSDRLLLVWEPESQVVLVFDHDRSTPIRLTSLWSTGDGPESFGNLIAMEWDHDAGRLYMIDSATGQLHAWGIDLPPADEPRFDPDMGRLLSTRPLPAPIAGGRIIDAVRMPDGGWAMLDGADAVIHVLDAELQPKSRVPSGVEHPVALAHDPSDNTLLVLGRSNVTRLDRTGTVLRHFDLQQPERPAGLAVHPDHSILVTDTGTHAVHRFNADGTHLNTWGQQGTDHAMLWRPVGVAVDAEGDVFVLDHGNHRCQVFTPDGQWTMSFGAGRAYTPLNLPRDHPLKQLPQQP